MFRLTVNPEAAPDKPEYIEVEFERGDAVGGGAALPCRGEPGREPTPATRKGNGSGRPLASM
jgi:hypothetical protein